MKTKKQPKPSPKGSSPSKNKIWDSATLPDPIISVLISVQFNGVTGEIVSPVLCNGAEVERCRENMPRGYTDRYWIMEGDADVGKCSICLTEEGF